ncbi:hypothetical protein L4C39_00750 [Vibrio clamense]|uniref:hypothetical protein n=1 Tax=Vibrio clamense TaxID=2910254 RepID=UPI003D24F9F9
MSGVAIPFVKDRIGNTIYIDQYEDLGYPTPIFCGGRGCGTRVTHVVGHKRRNTGKLIPAIFRLYQNFDHSDSCSFKTSGNYEIEAKIGTSNVEDAIADGETLFRVHILNHDEASQLKQKEEFFADQLPEDTTKRVFYNKGKMPCYVKACSDLAKLYIYGKENPKERDSLEIKVNKSTVKWKDFFFGIGQYRYFQHCLTKDKYVNAAIDLQITRKVFSGVVDDFEYFECKPKNVKGTKYYPIIRISKKLKLPIIDFDKQFLVYGKFRLRNAEEPKVSSEYNAVEFMTTLVNLKQMGEVPTV